MRRATQQTLDTNSEDHHHPTIRQVEAPQHPAHRRTSSWSLVCPSLASSDHSGRPRETTQTVDDQADILERCASAITQLEACLNPRGVRVGRLRKAISQLRPILIHAVANSPLNAISARRGNHVSFCTQLIVNSIQVSIN